MKKKIQLPPFYLISIIVFCHVSFLKAQTNISLKDAIDSAINNNRSLQNNKIRADYFNALKYTAWDVPPTNISYETGNIFSSYTDNRLGITQKIAFPIVYSRRQSVLNEEAHVSETKIILGKKELIRAVSDAYVELSLLSEKIKLLQFADSVYASFADNVTMRLDNGAANILEKATAVNQKGQIQMQLQLAISDFESKQLELKLLMNSDVRIIPKTEEIKLNIFDSVSKLIMDDLPEIRLLSEEKKIAEANLKLLYTAYYPELFLGYYNQSIQGWHLIDGNEIFTDNSYRFHSAVIGLGIPFISNSQTAKIKANKYQVLLAQNSLQLEIERLQNQIMTQLEVYNKMNSLMKEYNTFLKNSDDLLKATFERLHQDEIDVMQFVFMINQAISTKCAYLELMKKKNQVAVEINYLTSK